MDNLDKDQKRDQHPDNDNPPQHSNTNEEAESVASTNPRGEIDSDKIEPLVVVDADNNDLSNVHSNSSTMEVHHHGHVHEKKKWKEYVFQFFMLFLAVFCGFLAEYQLEHTIEHNREEQFMVSLVKDLETDTSQLNNIKNFRLRNLTRIDSAIAYLVTHEANSLPLKHLRNFGLGLRSFYQNSGTLDQLKNSGGLRLIRKRNIVDSISSYDQLVKRMLLRDKYETDKLFNYATLLEKMFDGKAMAKMYADTTFFQKPPPSQETMVSMKTEYLGEFLNLLLSARNSYQSNLSLQETLRGKAERLIETIKREYSLP